MTVRGGGGGWWVVGVAVGLVAFALGVLLVRAGLEDADRWASVIGVFLNLAGLVVAVYSAVKARRAATTPPAAGGRVDNRIGRGEFTGAVIMGRDLEQLNATGEPVPDPAAGRPPSSAPQPGGRVSNIIEDGQFGGPVIMGRDMRGVVLPSPTGRKPDVDESGR